jgi:F-type H+-transporting ATPase subunit delta
MRNTGAARSIAARYGKALLAVVLGEEEDPLKVAAELAAINRAVGASPELARALASPAIAPRRKEIVLDAVLAGFERGKPLQGLLKVMSAKDRLSFLGLVEEAYRRAVDVQRGVEAAEVTSPKPLSPDQTERLAADLSALLGKKVRLQFRTDEAILGGLTVRVGNRIYDASLVTQLHQFKKRALAAS